MVEISMRPAELIEHVARILADGEPRLPREIHRVHHLNHSAVRCALLALVRQGRVVREGEIGTYRYRLITALKEAA